MMMYCSKLEKKVCNCMTNSRPAQIIIDGDGLDSKLSFHVQKEAIGLS